MERENILVCYTDGGAWPNPGYAGFGVFGYILKPSKKPKNINYPAKTNYQYTSHGIIKKEDVAKDKTLGKESYEVFSIVDHIGSINNEEATNNMGELLGVTKALHLAITDDSIKLVRVICDSKYVLSNLEEHVHNWKARGWTTSTGAPVKNKDMWIMLDDFYTTAKEKGIEVDLKWVKGHDGTLGNEIADMYATIGTNYSRIQFEDNQTGENFNESCFSEITDMATYKKQLVEKHYLYEYKNAIFGTVKVDDSDLIYLTNPPTVRKDIGMRNLESTYAILHKGVPNSVDSIRRAYRRIPRHYDITAIINLDLIKDDKVLSRVVNQIGYEPIVSKYKDNQGHKLMTFSQKGILVEELDSSYSFIKEVYETYTIIENTLLFLPTYIEDNKLVDLTDKIVNDEGKIVLNFGDKNIDLHKEIEEKLEDMKLVSKGILTIGRDTPSFSIMKTLADQIDKVYLYPNTETGDNLATFVFILVMKDGSRLAHTNLLSKYLVKYLKPISI